MSSKLTMYSLLAILMLPLPIMADDDDHSDSHSSDSHSSDSDSSSSSSSSSSGSSGGSSSGGSSQDSRHFLEQQAAKVDRSPGYRKEFSASQLSRLKTLRAVYLTDQKKKALFSFEVSERNREEAVTAISNELESQGFSAVAAGDVQSAILEQLN